MLEATGVFSTFLAVYFGFGFLTSGSRSGESASLRVARSLTLSFWLCFLPALALSRVHALTTESVGFVVIILAIFAAWRFFKTRRITGATSHRRWLIIALCSVVLFHALELRHGVSVRGGFFYLSEIKDVTSNHGLPALVIHFGEQTEPQVDKLGFTQLGSFAQLITGCDLLSFSRVGYLVSVLLVALAAFGFFITFLSPPLAACATIFSFTNLFTAYVTTSRSFYLPENVALIYLFAAATLYWNALQSPLKSRVSQILWAAAGSAACMLNHLEIGLLLMILLGGINLGQCKLSRLGADARTAIALITIICMFVVGSYTILGIAPDFIRSAVYHEHYSAYQGNDPTYEFLAPYGHHTPFTTVPKPHSLRELLTQGLRLQGKLFHSPAGTVAALSFGFFIFALFTHQRRLLPNLERYRVAGLAAISSILVLVLVAVWSDGTFAIWVYQTEALRRIIPYCSLFLTVYAFSGLDCLAHSVRALRHAAIGIAFVVTTVFYLLSAPLIYPLDSPFRLSSDGYLMLRYLADKPNSHVLVPEITNGAFHTLTSSQALLEGHQPVLRPAMILQTLSLLEDARSFFREPAVHESFLLKHNISHVLVAKSDRPQFGGSMLLPYPEIYTVWRQIPFLCDPISLGELELFQVCPTEEENSLSH